LSRSYNITEITFSIPPVAPRYQGDHCPLVNPLAQYNFDPVADQVWVVSLQKEMKEIRSSYSYQTRRDIKNATDYSIYEVQSMKDLGGYYKLHLETCERTGADPHPLAYFRTVFERFLPSGRCRLLFFIQKGEIVASQCTGIFKGGANYWFGASRTIKPKHGGENRVLFDRQFELARQAGVEWYFMGNAFAKGNLAGISEFKGSFGSQLFPYFRSKIIFNPSQQIFFQHLQVFKF